MTVALFNLPTGWAWRDFGDVAVIKTNLVEPSDHSGLLHLAPNHVVPETGRYEHLSTVEQDGVRSKKHLVEPGLIVYSKIRPYLRKATIAKTELLCSADMYPVASDVDHRFLMWWMLTGAFTQAAMKGRSVIPKINQKELNALPVPVPPRDEQQRIVAEIERLLPRLSRLQAGLRATIGRLPILQAVALRDLVTDSGPTKLLPEVVEILDSKRVPVNARERAARPGTVPYYGATGQAGTIDTSLFDEPLVLLGEDGVAFDRPEARKAYSVSGPSWVNNHAHVLRPTPVVRRDWLEAALNAADYRGRYSGTTRLKLTQTAMRQLQIPLPPLDEQDVRLERLRAVGGTSSRLEITATRDLTKSAALRRAILKAAFEGRL